MTFTLSTFETKNSWKTDLQFKQEDLQELPCGLHRVPLVEAYGLMPFFSNLYDSVPDEIGDPENWEIDLKIHMLMKGQFPCIPNWHCDNVPRDEDGVNYGLIYKGVQPMYLWVSGSPETEFLDEPVEVGRIPRNHGDLAQMVSRRPFSTKNIQANQWVTMNQNTPHRGVQAQEYGWRVFARLTHKSILPQRPVISKVRRHAQVYLPYDFYW